MIISIKQIFITIAVLSIGLASFSGDYYAIGTAYGQEYDSHFPPIDIPGFPDLPDLPEIPQPPCPIPCLPGNACIPERCM